MNLDLVTSSANAAPRTHRVPPPRSVGLDVARVREHFPFVARGRIATNNAASTRPPREPLELLATPAPEYDNVHRGQSQASRKMTELRDDAYQTTAEFLHAPYNTTDDVELAVEALRDTLGLSRRRGSRAH